MASGLIREKMKSFSFCIWFYFIVLFPILSKADRLETKDGSILFGTVIEAMDGNLSFQTSYLSKIEIPLSEIASLSTSSNISIRDDDNRTYFGQSTLSINQNLTIQNKKNKERLNFVDVQHLWTENTEDPLLLAAEIQKEELIMKWKSSVGFDLVGSSGNTDSLGAGLRLDSTYSNKIRELDLFLSYNTQTTNGKTDTDETKGGAEYDALFHDQLAWYLRSDFEHDPIEQINLRLTGAIGLKYDWIETDNFQFSNRLGTAVRYEDSIVRFEGDKVDPAFDLGLEYIHLLYENLLLESELTLLPTTDNLSDYLFNHDTALIFPLLPDNAWHIRSGLSGTYDSMPKNDTEKMDLKYYFRLNFDFQ
jgi:putative salt-induced outer membrane protein YdiY